MLEEGVKSVSWAGSSSLYHICLEVREYKKQEWKKTRHLSVLSLQERVMHSQMHVVLIPPSWSLVSKALLVRFFCVCAKSVCLPEQHSQPLSQAAQLGLPPGGYSLWVAADSSGSAAGVFLSF